MSIYPNTPISDGFDSPVGLAAPATLTADGLWLSYPESIGHYLGTWRSCNDIGNYYYLGANNTKPAYHTGVDFVLAFASNYNSAAHQPLYASTNAIVTYATRWPPPAWGNLIVLRTYLNRQYVWVRYAHVEDMLVKKGDVVKRGQPICKVGNGFGAFVYHLHYDISLSGVLENYAGDWPGTRLDYLYANYTDPLTFTRANRPRKAPPVIVKKLVVPGIEAHQSFYLSSPTVRIYPTGTEIEVDSASGTLDPETGITMVGTPTGTWIPAALVGLPELEPPQPPATVTRWVNNSTGLNVRATGALDANGNPTGAIVSTLTNKTEVQVVLGTTTIKGHTMDQVVSPVQGYVADWLLTLTAPH